MSYAIGALEGYDLAELVFEATCQIPRGMVSTYGDVAKALGDIKASRVVGTILSQNPRTIVVPCHRVVYGDGRTGWYSGQGKGADRKVELLKGEGVPIDGGVVQDFGSRKFTDFHIRPVLREMQEEQANMARKVIEVDDGTIVERVVGLDVSYSKEEAFATACTYDVGSRKVEYRSNRAVARFPYIPSYLGFREVPVVEPLLDGLRNCLVMVDGQGMLHPRRFGIACHLGVRFDLPTIGVAKSLLSGDMGEDGGISLDGERLGQLVLAGRRKYFVSVGHRVSLRSAISTVERYMAVKDTDVLRLAHLEANRIRREAEE